MVNPPDWLTTRTVDQPVVQTPDQPPVQAPDPPTPPESRVVGEPTQRVDRQPSPPVTEAHPAAQPEPQGIVVDQEVVNILRNIVEEQGSLREAMTETSRDVFQTRVSTEMLKGGQGRLFEKLSEVVDEQMELKCAVEELREWRRTTLVNAPEQIETAIVKEEPTMLQVLRRDDEDARSELSYATHKDDLRGDPTGGDHRQRDPPPHLSFGQFMARRSHMAAHAGEHGYDRTIRRETVGMEESRTQTLTGNFERVTTGQPLARSLDVRLEEQEQPVNSRRSVTLPHEIGFGAPPRHTGKRGDERGGREPSWPGDDNGSSHSSDHNRGPGRDLGGRDRRRRSRSRSSGHSGQSRQGGGGSSGQSSPSGPSEDDWDAESDDSYLLDRGRRRCWGKDRDDPLSKYQKSQLKDIRDRISKMVGRELTYSANYRGAKDSGSSVKKFSGGNNYEEFMEWLEGILLHFLNNRMCGPDNEMVRITSMASFLEGRARCWFSDHVTNSRSRKYWNSKGIVCGLFNAFVFGSAASQAAKAFQEVRYSWREGALAFSEELKAWARRLVRKPDESTMIFRFLSGVPVEMRNYLTSDKQLDPARHRLHDFVRTLHKHEEATQVTRTTNLTVGDEYRRTREYPLRLAGDQRQDQDRGREEPKGKQEGPLNEVKIVPRKDLTRGRVATKDTECFKCGRKGHFASDPQCPKFDPNDRRTPRQRLRAVRIGDGSDGELGPDQEEDTLELADGSQYDTASDREATQDGDPGGSDARLNRVLVDALSEEEGSGDVVYVRAIRAKVVAAQEENPSRSSLRKKIDRPTRTKAVEACLAAYIRINGMDAFALFDSGSTTDSLSPDFARTSDVRVHRLEKQIPLQLGTVGSRASINFGTRTSVAFAGREEPRYYFDIVNIDRYDAIVGAVFLRHFGIKLDFTTGSIVVGKETVKALLPEEEAAVLKGRARLNGLVGNPGRGE